MRLVFHIQSALWRSAQLRGVPEKLHVVPQRRQLLVTCRRASARAVLIFLVLYTATELASLAGPS